MSVDCIDGSERVAAGHLQDAVGGLIGDRTMQARGMFDEAAGSVQRTFGQVENAVRGGLDGTLGKARKTGRELSDFVGERPYLVTGVALGFGLVLGALALGASRVLRERV